MLMKMTPKSNWSYPPWKLWLLRGPQLTTGWQPQRAFGLRSTFRTPPLAFRDSLWISLEQSWMSDVSSPGPLSRLPAYPSSPRPPSPKGPAFSVLPSAPCYPWQWSGLEYVAVPPRDLNPPWHPYFHLTGQTSFPGAPAARLSPPGTSLHRTLLLGMLSWDFSTESSASSGS